MAAVFGKTPDRLPVTIHQWQPYHLQHFMGGRDQLAAFLATGLDASVTPLDIYSENPSADWQCAVEENRTSETEVTRRHRVQTPGGVLTWTMVTNEYTTFHGEHPIKNQRDAELFAKYWPGVRLDRCRIEAWHDRIGDAGILRGFTGFCCQPGPWQDLCELAGTQEAIFWAMDEPEFVHWFLEEITRHNAASRMPERVIVSVSEDGKAFKQVATISGKDLQMRSRCRFAPVTASWVRFDFGTNQSGSGLRLVNAAVLGQSESTPP